MLLEKLLERKVYMPLHCVSYNRDFSKSVSLLRMAFNKTNSPEIGKERVSNFYKTLSSIESFISM